MTQRTLCLALTAIATAQFAAVGYGQGGGLLNSAAANRAAAQAQTQQRVQQRANAQVQQRANAQVQQRVQAQVQQRVQSTLGDRVRGAAAMAAGTAQRVQRQQTQERRIGATAGVNARTNANANVAGTAVTADSRIRVNGSGRLVLPGPALLGNGEVNVKYFDNVFGRFNPFRRTEPATDASSASQSQLASGAVLSGNADGTNGASEPASEESQEPRQQNAGTGIANQGTLHTQVDLSQAVRLRRSEISAMRDHALATGNAQLMASADQLEGILDRFVQAQAAAEAQARTTARSAASETGNLQTGVEAAASGQTRAVLNGGQRRVAQRPEGPRASAASDAAASASQATTVE